MKRSFEDVETCQPADSPVCVSAALKKLELWGGIECTHNRVGENYFSQVHWNGHLRRPEDLDRFAGLGIRALRYPVIWEMLAPERADAIDWGFTDERLPRLRELGVRPIAALVHHGSGPRYASIETPGFAEGLAKYAGEVARRYPWMDAYTPVNEPLTTARFCGLYGLWHPHGRADQIFARIVVNECRATVLAMRAIRRVNPDAQLIQTDDLGHIHSTPYLAYEAEFQNHRRWLCWDLLCGMVGPDHALWHDLLAAGIAEKELYWFQDYRCPPDVIGINHYPTSDRFLDENVERYRGIHPATNGRDVYVDVEAVRVRDCLPGGFHERLLEAWDRYHLPLAITESHLGCTREEQIRWFAESWKSAERAQGDGADVRAVTAWSLLGAYNWNTLVTRDADYYEPGVFDVRGGEPRPTAIASLLSVLGAGEEPEHPALEHPGWWHRPERLFESHRESRSPTYRRTLRGQSTSPVLILGARGTLGQAFVHACEVRGLAYHAFCRKDLDLSDEQALCVALNEVRPWAVINATGYVRVDDAESDETSCFAVNTAAAVRLASACEDLGASLLCFSSDLVFDGQQQTPYLESHMAAPLNAYGRSKEAMERGVLEASPAALIARTSAFFGPVDDWNVVTQTLRALRRGERIFLPDDQVVSPTYVPDLVEGAFDLLIDGTQGIWHLANAGQVSWVELVRIAARHCGVDDSNLHGCSHVELKQTARRPAYSALGTEKGQILPSFDASLARYAREAKL
jgi:dTDP-4-dehydrorhamnose reductase